MFKKLLLICIICAHRATSYKIFDLLVMLLLQYMRITSRLQSSESTKDFNIIVLYLQKIKYSLCNNARKKAYLYKIGAN